MTTNNHPITPPPELVEQWMTEAHDQPPGPDARVIATQAARWAADQELEACLVEIRDGAGRIYIDETRLRLLLAEDIWTARRPQPPSLKEQALEQLRSLQQCGAGHRDTDKIRRALEQLDD